MFAKLVAVEGADKCGKATQSRLLMNSLRQRSNARVAQVEVPFNDGITYRLIYWMLKHGQARQHPNLFQFLQFINKFVFQWTKLLWLRLTCDFIILDRWSLSAIVYGDAGGADQTFNRALHMFLVRPDLTIVLDGQSFKRCGEVDDVYEKDSALQRAVRKGYRDWVTWHPFDHVLVDNQGGREVVHDRIRKVVKRFVDGACL